MGKEPEIPEKRAWNDYPNDGALGQELRELLTGGLRGAFCLREPVGEDVPY